MAQTRQSVLLSPACAPALAVADELRALLGPAGELAWALAGETAAHRPEYRRLVKLADTIDFANEVLNHSISGSGERSDVWSAFSVDAVAREILPVLRASVQGKAKVTLAEDSHSPLLRGNPFALKRALLHIVRTLAGTIEVAHGLIEIGVTLATFSDITSTTGHGHLTALRRVVRLTVADNGIGISPDLISELLQSRSGNATQLRSENVGLQIASSIVKAQGGVLDIESHPGMGTMVRIDLPLVWPGRQP